MPDSPRLRFIRALDLRRSVLRAPALSAAVAARECGEWDEGEGGDAGAGLLAGERMREVDGEREGGRELRSGAILMLQAAS